MTDWIEWNGGECPVEKGTLIDVRYRSGEEAFGAPALIFNKGAGRAFWINENSSFDIVAYRLAVKEKPKIKYLNREGEELYVSFIVNDRGCRCHINPPCSKCTDPGNPMNLMESEEYWVEASQLPEWQPAYYFDEESQSIKGVGALAPVIPSKTTDLIWGSW